QRGAHARSCGVTMCIESDDGDAFHPAVGRPIELFAEDVGVELRVVVPDSTDERSKLRPEDVLALDHRGCGVEQQAAAWPQPLQRVARNADGETGAQL